MAIGGEHDDVMFGDPTPSNDRDSLADGDAAGPGDALRDPADAEPGEPAAPGRGRTAASPAPSGLAPELLAEAQQLGIADTIRDLDQETARRHIDLLRTTLGQMALAAQRGPEPPAAPAPVPTGPTAQSVAPNAGTGVPQPPGAPTPAPFSLKPMDVNDFDPSVQAMAENVRGLHDHFSRQMNDLQSAMMRIEQMAQEAALMSYRNEFDRYVADAGDEYAEVLGQSPSQELDPQATEYQNRVKVVQQMDILRAGYLVTGHRPPSNRTLFLRACAQLFPQAQQTAARKELERRMRDHRGRFAPTPVRSSSNGEPAAEGERAAFDHLRSQYRQMVR